MLELSLLFFAGLLGGVLNSLGGGGSFITFPALLFVGVAPISANATNTFSSSAGYLSGTYAFKSEILENKKRLPLLLAISLIGGVVGAWLLLHTPENIFQKVIPWILLFATLLFAFGERLSHFFKELSSLAKKETVIGHLLLLSFLLIITIYAGFSNTGSGIIILSYLALAGYTNIHVMNGFRLLLLSTLSFISVSLFIYKGAIAWPQGISVLLGSLVGGYISARISRRLPQKHVRIVILIMSSGITAYFFLKTYLHSFTSV